LEDLKGILLYIVEFIGDFTLREWSEVGALLMLLIYFFYEVGNFVDMFLRLQILTSKIA
jgi:Na+-transporting methylmalonyl-CoA/oxaloacetate decarboxylase gamma subunit